MVEIAESQKLPLAKIYISLAVLQNRGVNESTFATNVIK